MARSGTSRSGDSGSGDAATRDGVGTAVITGAVAMGCVGGSVAVSAVLGDAPLLTAQAIRYAGAAVLLLVLARVSGRVLPWPRGAEWAWLVGVAVTGLILFNIALVRGGQDAEPAVLGVAVACVPLVLAVAGPLLERRRPAPALLGAAGLVTTGAVMVEGGGHTSAAGLGWAAMVLLCEAGFTLLAVPVLHRLGAWALSVHATWLGALMFAGLGLALEGPQAALSLSRREILAMIYLAVAVTAIAFLLWYSAVGRLGPGRAGLLTGVAPAAAAISGMLLSDRFPGPVVWAGIGVVATGLALGLRHHNQPPFPDMETYRGARGSVDPDMSPCRGRARSGQARRRRSCAPAMER